MQRWTDSGLAIFWIKKQQPPDQGCVLAGDYDKNVDAGYKALTLIDLSSAFILLLMGYGTSVLQFMFEIAHQRIIRFVV